MNNMQKETSRECSQGTPVGMYVWIFAWILGRPAWSLAMRLTGCILAIIVWYIIFPACPWVWRPESHERVLAGSNQSRLIWYWITTNQVHWDRISLHFCSVFYPGEYECANYISRRWMAERHMKEAKNKAHPLQARLKRLSGFRLRMHLIIVFYDVIVIFYCPQTRCCGKVTLESFTFSPRCLKSGHPHTVPCSSPENLYRVTLSRSSCSFF